MQVSSNFRFVAMALMALPCPAFAQIAGTDADTTGADLPIWLFLCLTFCVFWFLLILSRMARENMDLARRYELSSSIDRAIVHGFWACFQTLLGLAILVLMALGVASYYHSQFPQ